MDITGAVTLLNTAGLGVMAYLLLTKVESRIGALERSVNRLVVMRALELVATPGTSAAVKREARELLREIRPNGDYTAEQPGDSAA